MAQDSCHGELGTGKLGTRPALHLSRYGPLEVLQPPSRRTLDLWSARFEPRSADALPVLQTRAWRGGGTTLTATRLSITIRFSKGARTPPAEHLISFLETVETEQARSSSGSGNMFVWIGCRCLALFLALDAGTRCTYPHACWVATGSSRSCAWRAFTAPRHPVLQAMCMKAQLRAASCMRYCSQNRRCWANTGLRLAVRLETFQRADPVPSAAPQSAHSTRRYMYTRSATST